MNYQINIPLIKKKTEIEDKLLLEIKNNFEEYINDFEYIKNNFTQIDYNQDLDTNKYLIIDKYIKLIEQNNIKDVQEKFFEFPKTIYSVFQCFYLKRKNYIGMNLTGLIQGKMETGLGFRSNINKLSHKNIKDDELKNIINKYFINSNTDNINLYKLNSNGFNWNEIGSGTYRYIYLIANLTTQKYIFLLEN
jgi:hypothetical protein